MARGSAATPVALARAQIEGRAAGVCAFCGRCSRGGRCSREEVHAFRELKALVARAGGP